MYRILSSIVCIFYIENDAEIFPVHYTRNVAEKRIKIAFMMIKLAMIISFEIILDKIKIIFLKKSMWNSGAYYTCMHIILNKIQ